MGISKRQSKNKKTHKKIHRKQTDKLEKIIIDYVPSKYKKLFSYLLTILVSTNHNNNIKKYYQLFKILILQEEYNSLLFTSHGLDHSIRTVNYILMLYFNTIKITKYDWTKPPTSMVYKFLKKKYKCDHLLLLNSIIWLGLLHDVGYVEYDICQKPKELKHIKNLLCNDNNTNINCNIKSCVGNKLGLNIKSYRKYKFIHAYLGYMAIKLMNDGNTLFYPKISNDILDSIKYHNYDSKNTENYKPKENGQLLTIENTDTIRRYYKSINIKDNPIDCLLRLGDNLDISTDRLPLEKNLYSIILFMREYTTMTEINKKTVAKLWKHCINIYPIKQAYNKYITNLIIENINKTDFKYTYMCFIIKSINITIRNNHYILDVDIRKINDKDTLSIKYNWMEGILNFTRMNDALKSIYINSKPLNNMVIIKMLDRSINLSVLSKTKSYMDFMHTSK